MNKFPMNPFRFGDPVEGDFYLPRPDLSRVVSQFLKNQIHVVLIGPRRFGKTSFVMNLLKDLEKEQYTCIFVDIFNITSHRDFVQQILRALKTRRSWVKELIELIPRLRPKLSAELDPNTTQSSLSLTFDKSSDKDVKDIIQDLLAGLEKLGRRVIFTIDEFQKITEIGDQGWLEATLRTHMQQLKNTSFLFTGSRKSIIHDMLNNRSRPLYRSCQLIEFPSFGIEFSDWVIRRFDSVGIECKRDAVEYLRNSVQNTPNYVQMAGFHLVAEGKSCVTTHEIETTLETIVRQNAYAYQTLLNSLTSTQQRALRLAAKEEKQIFTKELLVKYEITSAQALSSAIKSLKDKGILDEEGTSRGNVIFDDPLFAIWLKISFDE